MIFVIDVCLMEVLYFLIPIALIIAALAIKVFFWAVNNGQYDDLNTEGRRILFDDAEDLPTKAASEPTPNHPPPTNRDDHDTP